jgi:hypothetical protein
MVSYIRKRVQESRSSEPRDDPQELSTGPVAQLKNAQNPCETVLSAL